MDEVVLPEFSKYSISSAGFVKDLRTGNFLVPEVGPRGGWIVRLQENSRDTRLHSFPLGKLVRMAFDPPKRDWRFTDLIYKDKNWMNACLDNTYWTYDQYEPPTDYNYKKGTEYIPNIFNTAFVNSYGEVYVRGSDANVTENIKGYLMLSVFDHRKNRQRKIPVHQIVALTFLQHPYDTSFLVVNHIDGNVKNNHYRNLEWTTYTGNAVHAFQTDLRNGNKPILVMDVETREVTEHHSLYTYCKATGLDEKVQWNRLHHSRPFHPAYGVFIKYADDPREWPAPDTVFERKTDEGIPVRITFPDGSVEEYTSIAKASKAIGVTPGAIEYVFKKKTSGFCKGHFVERIEQ